MSEKKKSRYRSWPRWAVSTLSGVFFALAALAIAAIGFGATLAEAMVIAGPILLVVAAVGAASEVVSGILAGVLEVTMGAVGMVMALPLLLMEGCG